MKMSAWFGLCCVLIFLTMISGVRANDFLFTADANTTDGTLAIDSVNGSDNGTLTGAYTNTTGMIAEAYNLSGGATLDVPFSEIGSSTEGACVSFWYNPNDNGVGGVRPLFGVDNGQFFIFINDGQGKTIAVGGGSGFAQYVFIPPPGVWTHVAATINTTHVELYVNGTLVASAAPGAWGAATIAQFGFAQAGYGSDSSGSFDAMHLFNGTCSPEKVASIYGNESMGTYFVEAGSPPPVVDVNYTVTVTANDTNTSSPILNFSATLEGDTESTTNGSIFFMQENDSYFINGSSAGYNVTTQNIVVAGDTAVVLQFTPLVTPCSPSWSCSSFGACHVGNLKDCLNVTDSNNCSVSFNGTLSSYNASCSYSPGGGSGYFSYPSSTVAQVTSTVQEAIGAPAPESTSTNVIGDFFTSIWDWIIGLFS